MTSAAGNTHGAGLQPERPRDVDAVDDPIDADAATRTSTPAPAPPAQLDSPANHVGEIAPARLPAPLQYRDPARYDILGEHGRGGLGRVFRARDREMGRDVAVKELLNRGASSELRFFREALITARLEHPGIVPVHEAGRWPDGTPFYAMKLVAGRPLKVLFENARTVEARLALLPHILAVADAIAYAHDRKIIHRDLKPANVIVGEFGETVVIDWGLAKDISPEAEDDEPSGAGPYRTAAPTPGVTVAGSVLGTPAYMAPEQARGELVDERADVYAIGAMLFQVCTGEKTPPTDVYKLHNSLGKSGVDVDLVSIVRKACAPEAGGRYRDAGKLAADLRSFTAGARVLARHYSAGALVSHWVKRHKRLAAAVAVMVVTVAVVGVVAFVRVQAERDRAEAATAAERRRSDELAETQQELNARHAELLLEKDPTAAYQLLQQYKSPGPRERYLTEKATAQGVAVFEDMSNRDTIHYLMASREKTTSLSEDGILKHLGNNQGSVLAADYSGSGYFDYAFRAGILAYPSVDSSIVLASVDAQVAKIAIDGTPDAISISPGATAVGLLSKSRLTIFQATASKVENGTRFRRTPCSMDHVVAFELISETEVAVVTGVSVSLRPIDCGAPIADIPLPQKSQTLQVRPLTASAEGAVAIALPDGVLTVDASGASVLRPCPSIASIVMSNDGRHLIAACQDGALWWHTSGAPGKLLYMHGAPFVSLTLAKSGNKLVAGAADGTAHFFNLATGAHDVFKGHAGVITAAAFIEDGEDRFVTGDTTGTVRQWAVPTDFSSSCVRTSADGIVAARRLGRCVVFATNRGLSARPLGKAANEVGSLHEISSETALLRLANDGRRLAALGPSGIVSLLGAHAATEPAQPCATSDGAHHFSEPAMDAAFTQPDELYVLLRSGGLYRWQLGDAAHVDLVGQAKGRPVGIEASAGRLYLASSEAISVWQDGKVIEEVLFRDETATMLLATVDGQAVLGTDTGEIYAVRAMPLTLARIGGVPRSVQNIAVSNDGQFVAVVDEGGTVALLEWSKRAAVFALSMKGRTLRFSDDGAVLAVGSDDGAVAIYHTAESRWSVDYRHRGSVMGIVFDDEDNVLSMDDTGLNCKEGTEN